MDKDVILKYYVGKLWRILRKADVKKESKPGFNLVLLNNLVTKRREAL